MSNKPALRSIADVVPEYNEDERELLALQESWADYSRALRTAFRVRFNSGRINFRGGSLAQVSATLDVHRAEFEEGNDAALIDALRVASDENVPLPYWVADGILAALAEVDANPVATLHSVFGMESRYPTSKAKENKRGIAARSDWVKKQRLYMRASVLIALEKMGKVAAIRRAIADERLHIGFRNAFDWFNEMDERQQRHLHAWRGVKLHRLR